MAVLEIAFLDVETTVPRRGQRFELLEFAAVVVAGTDLGELSSFSTLIRPSSPSLITSRSVSCNGITEDHLKGAPSFAEVADLIHELLHGRIWAGHNIARFDNARIKEAFALVNREAPVPAGIIDTLPLLREKFGQRAGNLKMATLASYFGLGKQAHRSLEDVRLNLEVLKMCATVVFLESNFPQIFMEATRPRLTRSRQEVTVLRHLSASEKKSSGHIFRDEVEDSVILNSATATRIGRNTNIEATATPIGRNTNSEAPTTSYTLLDNDDTFDFKCLSIALEEASLLELPEDDIPSTSDRHLKVDLISIDLLTAGQLEGMMFPLMHRGIPLCMIEHQAEVRFSVSDKYAFTTKGKPTFSIVIRPSSVMAAIVRKCEAIAKGKFEKMGYLFEWRSVLIATGGSEGLRIRIGTSGAGETATYTTKFHSRCLMKGELGEVDLGNVDRKVFQDTVAPGCAVDIAFHCDAYAFGNYAGIRLLADYVIL